MKTPEHPGSGESASPSASSFLDFVDDIPEGLDYMDTFGTPDPAAPDIAQNAVNVSVHPVNIDNLSPSGNGATGTEGFSQMKPSHQLPRTGPMSAVPTASVTSSSPAQSSRVPVFANVHEVNSIMRLLQERNMLQEALQQVAGRYEDALLGIELRNMKMFQMVYRLSALESEVFQLKSQQLQQLPERSRVPQLDQVEGMFRELGGQLRTAVMKMENWRNQRLGTQRGQNQNTSEVTSSVNLLQNGNQHSSLGDCKELFESAKSSISKMTKLMDEVRAGPTFIRLNPEQLAHTTVLPAQFYQSNRNNPVIILRGKEPTQLQVTNASLGQFQWNGNSAPVATATVTSTVSNVGLGNSVGVGVGTTVQNHPQPKGRKLPTKLPKTDTDAMLTCPKCLKGYSTKHSLKRHVRVTHRSGKFVCNVCGNCYEYEKNFQKHNCKQSGGAEAN